VEQERRAASHRHSPRRRSEAATFVANNAIPKSQGTSPFLTALVARLTWTCIVLAVVVTPLLVDPNGRDSFRPPKETFMVAIGIAIIAIGLLAVIFGIKARWSELVHARFLQLTTAIVAWSIITALASTNRTLSYKTLSYVVAFAAFATATYLVGRSASLKAVMLIFIAAIPNCVLYILQESRVWNPFATAEQIQNAWFARHIFSSALIGNPDDIGGYLLPIAIAAAALIVVAATRRQRGAAIAAAVAFGFFLVATQSWAAIGAYIAGLSTLLALTLRAPLRPILLVSLVGILVMVAYPPFRSRLLTVASTFAARKADLYAVDMALSNRLTPFAAAVGMARDHPLTGVGPGCFGWHYYGYKVKFENAHPEMRNSPTAYFNFGETHSDHLQTLAVSGIPGYALFLYAILLVAACSRRRHLQFDDADPRRKFSRMVGLPIAVAFMLHASMQFPLELASASSQMLFVAALCIAWRQDGGR
jgi:O-antigen ligase